MHLRSGLSGLCLLSLVACTSVAPAVGLAPTAGGLPAAPFAVTILPVAATAAAGAPTPLPLAFSSATAPPDAVAAEIAAFSRLLIPALGVDLEIVTVPVLAGEWDLSVLDNNVGWLKTTGAAPGDALAMVFAGHVTLSTGQTGPFASLWASRLDETEIIYRSGGTDYVYVVKLKTNAGPNDAQRLYVKDGQKILLITCTAWNYLTFQYDSRLIVEAGLSEQRPTP